MIIDKLMKRTNCLPSVELKARREQLLFKLSTIYPARDLWQCIY